jgi:hypothetical protein
MLATVPNCTIVTPNISNESVRMWNIPQFHTFTHPIPCGRLRFSSWRYGEGVSGKTENQDRRRTTTT